MEIQSIQYQNEDQTSLLVDTGEGSMAVPWPCQTWHGAVIQEWLDAGGVIAGVPLTPLEVIAKGQKQALITDSQAEVNAYAMEQYPAYEIETWKDQEKEALAYQEDPTVPTPGLARIAEIRGMTLDVLVPKVIEKATAFRNLAFHASAIRQAHEDKIDSAMAGYRSGTFTDEQARSAILAVTWPGI